MASIVAADCHVATPWTGGWEMASFAPDEVIHPRDLVGRGAWHAAEVPGTVAASLRAAGLWQIGARSALDESDWWFRASFLGRRAPRVVLHLNGLATIADVWLNGERLVRSENMFHEHTVDVTGLVREHNDVAIRFCSLAALLKAARPRPRWRTRLVGSQQLRWFRTSLLGRIPAWTPPVVPVGPWRGVRLEERWHCSIHEADVRATVDGRRGRVRVSLRLECLDGERPSAADLVVENNETELRSPLTCREVAPRTLVVEGELWLDDVMRWWPHTHGPQPLYAVHVLIHTPGRDVLVDLGRVGFRSVEVDTCDGGFEVRVNGERIFCRGACWTPTDPVTLTGKPEHYERDLDRAKAAGMNMLRLLGTMHYEDDRFYAGCDERGILVWQDLAFANMDYPVDEPRFAASVAQEVRQLFHRLQSRACLAVVCGNTEVEQQVAMLGLPRQLCDSRLFDETIPEVVHSLVPEVHYVRSTPSGGGLPFRVDRGLSHYYGVGGYMRPVEDARRAGVRFASECLGLAHVPEPHQVDALLEGRSPAVDPAWKERVPRDTGAAWDFDDVRDHYLRELFGVDPLAVRREDAERYLALSRVASGEVIARVIAEWRRPASTCRGALVWLFRDLWLGAGWGLLDSSGLPKAAFFYASRAMQPVALLGTDEGCNGLALHVVNDGGRAVEGLLRVTAFRDGEVPIARGELSVSVLPRSGLEVRADEVLPHFIDTTAAYRFGPPGHDVVYAELREGNVVAGRCFFLPGALPTSQRSDLGVEAIARPTQDGRYLLTIATRRFAQAVAIHTPGHVPGDAYFHIEPAGTREVELVPVGRPTALHGVVHPLNARAPTQIRVEPVRS